MIYLSGCKNASIAGELASGRIGFLKTPSIGNTLDGAAVWAVDNGCFAGKYPGDDGFIAFLGRHLHRQADCLFVAVPDVIGDGQATLDNYPSMARRIRSAGWPVALVGQDGMEDLEIPWGLVDWLFIGGSTEWKLGEGAARLIRRAKAEGKSVHVGRVNSRKRFLHFYHLGCDSVDGTFLAFGPAVNAPKLLKWIEASEKLTEGEVANACRVC